MLQAPSYNWVCHICQAVNSAGTSVCASCAAPAQINGKLLGKQNATQQPPITPKETAPPSIQSAIGVFLCGLYLLAGAVVSITQEKWPFFMPAQLDGIAMLSRVFGETASAYIAGGITALFGVVCLIVAYVSARDAA